MNFACMCLNTPYTLSFSDCAVPEFDESTRVNFTGLMHDEKATYTCNDGYDNFVGVEERTCQDGVWSNEPPKCSPKGTDLVFM